MSTEEMAEGGSADGKPKWPGVTVTDEKPASVSIILKIPGLEVKKSIIGPKKAKNADIHVEFDTRLVDATVKLTGGPSFEYKKTMPEDIDASKSKGEVFKEDRVKLLIVKAKSGSWERHARYLTTPDKV